MKVRRGRRKRLDATASRGWRSEAWQKSLAQILPST